MPNKLSGAAADFIRKVFGRETQKSELSVSSRQLMKSALSGVTGASQVDVSNSGGIADAIGLDRRLLQRYSDYEQMDEYPEVSTALDIYADNATQADSATGNSVWVEAKDQNIKDELEDMLWDRLKIEDEIQPIARTLCKYGSDYEEIIVSDMGVVDLRYMSPPSTRRVENDHGDLLGFVQSYAGDLTISPQEFEKMKKSQGVAISDRKDVAFYDDWRVANMRLLSRYRDAMYGFGVCEQARWIWKRLVLLEDAVMVYKLSRSPSRFAFYVDTGKLPEHEASKIIEATARRIKKRKFVNPKTGKLDLRFNPLSMDEDFFLGVRDGRETTRVDTLNGPSYQQVEDVQYFLNKLYTALKIPRAYMGDESNMPSRATLSAEDANFGRSVLRIQRELRSGLDKVARVNLAAKNIDPDSVEFDIMMTVPSAIFELGQMEVRRARADLASMMERHVSLNWILDNVYGLSDDEIAQIAKDRKSEQPPQGSGGFESIKHRLDAPVLLDGNAGGISERELLCGNREDEKRVEEVVKKAMADKNNPFGRRLDEIGMLLRDIVHSQSFKK